MVFILYVFTKNSLSPRHKISRGENLDPTISINDDTQKWMFLLDQLVIEKRLDDQVCYKQ